MINHQPAKEKGMGCSLFQRYAKILKKDVNETLPKDKDNERLPKDDSMLMLTTQYRMVSNKVTVVFIMIISQCIVA